MAKQLPNSKVLNYSVQSSSGHSASYVPSNIRLNQPADQASRWSSASNDLNQFLVLKLDKMAILETIGFGKFHKVHVCNLKEFKVFAGPTLDNLHLILHTGLNNDTQPESFPPNYSLSPHVPPFPIQFIKIVPLAAWGSNFNFSIWYIELKGWEDSGNFDTNTNTTTNGTVAYNNNSLVQAALSEYKRAKEVQTTRLILKFLRQNRHLEAFDSLQKSSKINLEAPIVTQLHSLLDQNHLQQAEQLLIDLFAQDPHIFDQYLHENVPYTVQWKKIDTSTSRTCLLDENGDYKMTSSDTLMMQDDYTPCPSARGGHQMIWSGDQIFLLGGWDGKKDLADFWSFNPSSQSWKLISMNVAGEGGPSARSCHKAALNSSTNHIYVLGRYIDPDKRDPLNLPCDFYRYSIKDSIWTRLSSDVRGEGGPGCIYDHQMVVDEDENCIWVFGGRLLASGGGVGSTENSIYSGLYKCDLTTLQWTLLQSDNSEDNPTDSAVDLSPADNSTANSTFSVTANSTASVATNNTATSTSNNTTNSPLPAIKIPSRIGHSMLLDPSSRSLLILAGQRYKDQLADFYTYSLDRQVVTQICKNLQLVSGPEPGFTQRASLDYHRREMFVFSSSINRGNSNQSPMVTSSLNDQSSSDFCSFWVYDLEGCKWSKILEDSDTFNKPCPRFAHQIVYDQEGQTLYLFGGNPGNSSDPSARLSDLWSAKLTKTQSSTDLLRRCQYLIRRAKFETLIQDIPAALHFLQNDLAAVVDHNNPTESEAFRSLSGRLFLSPANENAFETNNDIFDEIVKLFPISMQPPSSNL